MFQNQVFVEVIANFFGLLVLDIWIVDDPVQYEYQMVCQALTMKAIDKGWVFKVYAHVDGWMCDIIQQIVSFPLFPEHLVAQKQNIELRTPIIVIELNCSDQTVTLRISNQTDDIDVSGQSRQSFFPLKQFSFGNDNHSRILLSFQDIQLIEILADEKSRLESLFIDDYLYRVPPT